MLYLTSQILSNCFLSIKEVGTRKGNKVLSLKGEEETMVNETLTRPESATVRRPFVTLIRAVSVLCLARKTDCWGLHCVCLDASWWGWWATTHYRILERRGGGVLETWHCPWFVNMVVTAVILRVQGSLPERDVNNPDNEWTQSRQTLRDPGPGTRSRVQAP